MPIVQTRINKSIRKGGCLEMKMEMKELGYRGDRANHWHIYALSPSEEEDG